MTRIVVVDNHGQFTHLERRALRDLGVDTELIDNETPPRRSTPTAWCSPEGPTSVGSAARWST